MVPDYPSPLRTITRSQETEVVKEEEEEEEALMLSLYILIDSFPSRRYLDPDLLRKRLPLLPVIAIVLVSTRTSATTSSKEVATKLMKILRPIIIEEALRREKEMTMKKKNWYYGELRLYGHTITLPRS
jgi:hypothetical protein